ncbi:MAG: DUF1793 domain-containing protein, partial [Bacteroidaceae bacterium]|nr:DUF1793 domain-containing protein [Bacteroidaceae bacterium]
SEWSIKYNLVWDRAWNWDMFSTERNSEQRYYTSKHKTYGLPLDERDGGLCKNDWHLWIAAFAEQPAVTKANRKWFFDTMWKFANECPTRKPLTDCHDANNAGLRLFYARSVVGGYWMPIFVKKFSSGELDPTAIPNLPQEKEAEDYVGKYAGEWYDLGGRRVSQPTQGGVYIRNGKKILK